MSTHIRVEIYFMPDRTDERDFNIRLQLYNRFLLLLFFTLSSYCSAFITRVVSAKSCGDRVFYTLLWDAVIEHRDPCIALIQRNVNIEQAHYN